MASGTCRAAGGHSWIPTSGSRPACWSAWTNPATGKVTVWWLVEEDGHRILRPAEPVLAGRRGGTRWDEIDTAGAVWTIPAERMKAARTHRVPLAPRALEVLDEARQLADRRGLVFPSPTGRTLSQFTMPSLLRDLEIGAVPHGFRSSFRDWAAECTDYPREVCELALAHVNSDRDEAAYRRSDLFEKRRTPMSDWADCVAVARS